MRVALISDVHANYEALRGLEPDLRSADRVVCLGDCVGYYCQVNEVLDAVRRLRPVAVLGNHDHYALHGCPTHLDRAVQRGAAYAARVLTPENRAWLAALPLVWDGELGGRRLLAAHGSPWNPLGDYLYADQPGLLRLREYDADVVAMGQTHRPLLRQEARPVLVNPGSVGQPRDGGGGACFAFWDTETMELELVRRFYPVGPGLRAPGPEDVLA